jgi:hypothetical protein
MIASGTIDPTRIVPRHQRLVSATEAFQLFEEDNSGWLQVAPLSL